MELLGRRETLELARRVLAASEADETEVTLASHSDRFVRFAGSGPTQSADRGRYHLAVRALFEDSGGRKEARATCDGVDPAVWRATLERATELARCAPADPELPPLGGAVEVEDRYPDDLTLAHTFEEKADWVRKALDACARSLLVPAGLAQTSGAACCLVNSAGREVFGARSRAAFSLTAGAPGFEGGSGYAEQIRERVGDLDPEGVIARAVGKALDNREPAPIEPGKYTVVLEPSAVSSLLLFASYHGWGAQEVHERSSFLCGRSGERLFPESLGITDDALHPLYAGGYAFDAEGTPRRPISLVERGVVGTPVTDRRWAAKLGVPNTGHALPQPSSHGPMAFNTVVAPGSESLDELIGGVERGLLVTQFHYTNMIDPKELTLTGMTRNGTFLIEDGRLRGAARNLRFTESLVGAFGRISGVGRDLDVAGALFDGEALCPALRIEDFQFTSSTEF
ncbi:MAG: hypothetical protein CMJ84_14065 [Planctomycetes bacterium]|jgi:predicted Zn-dependent protease|nr:hypothetical protein [Planctomycetota bacterium]MDP6409662.1 TldD/PmbA family protein [Planctomycetota bacterium]